MSFSYNSYVKFHGKNIGSHIINVLCPNMFYITRCVIKGLPCTVIILNSLSCVIKGQFYREIIGK